MSYLPSTGQDIYDADSLPPITAAVRPAWGKDGSPMPASDAMATLLVAVHSLETAVIAFETA